jgi:tRNA(Ile)-lysidine synthase TilS/MesJ
MKEDYPLYEKWFKILDWIMDRTNTYPKNIRFTMSQRIQNMALDVHDGIIEAIYTKKRLHILVSLNLYIEKLRSLMRLSYHRKYISMPQFEHIIHELNDAGKVLGGWIKSEQKHP